MAHTYILFDFGADEEKAQQALHKLQSWKQAFRLDKKLQFKFERGGNAERQTSPTQKRKAKAESSESGADKNGDVKLLVRLYFSTHERLSEQRWLTRIPIEEPFKGASPKVIKEDAAEFPEILKKFDALN
jgi:hypothetical protein